MIGDLEEAHRRRCSATAGLGRALRTAMETLDMAAALVRGRIARPRANRESTIVQDYKLGLPDAAEVSGPDDRRRARARHRDRHRRGWYDLIGDFMRPKLPLPDGDRIVEIEMRDAAANQDERRLLHDFLGWRRDVRSIEELGAYRTLERNLMLGDARPEPVTVAEITASAFRLASVPPLWAGRCSRPTNSPAHRRSSCSATAVWQGRFAGRTDVIGQTVQLGRTTTTVVGVMPEGFAFPINHRMWMPLQLQPSGYGPLEGAGISVFGRIAPGATQAQANTELVDAGGTHRGRLAGAPTSTCARACWRMAASRPATGRGSSSLMTHLPILLVLMVACANVGTLIYARTATREAEIAVRYALGAGRGRIVGQLFVEALVLASVAAVRRSRSPRTSR